MTQPHFTAQRRVVASHNEQGVGVITSDTELIPKDMELIPGAKNAPIWIITDSLPTNDNNNSEDGATRIIKDNYGLFPQTGSNLQTTELAPGASTPMHRTSSLDYNILLEGEVTLIMEDGSETIFKNVGDVVVMKGALHAWKNSSTKWCRWISVLVAAQPAVVQGKALESVL